MIESSLQHIESITEYNSLLGLKAIHPLVSVIDLSQVKPLRHCRYTFGFYAIFLKEVNCGDIIYGRRRYDYQDGTVVCLSPGQIIGVEDNGQTYQPRGMALCFHPDLIRGTSLARHIREYTYFSYEVNEALHLSQEERTIFTSCLDKIRYEIDNGADRLSRRLIATTIELLLDYCLRFYERQFDTRESADSDLLVRFEQLLDTYFDSGRARTDGLPTVRWCAAELCLSANYFGDLIKKATGRTAKEHIMLNLMARAKNMMLEPGRSITQISDDLGFQYSQHFTRMFKRLVGVTPNEYRHQTIC